MPIAAEVDAAAVDDSLVTEDVYGILKEHRKPDPAAYARRLNELPGDWPPPKPAR